MVAGLFTTSLLSLLLLLLLPISALAGPHGSVPLHNRHHELARRAEGNVQLHRRQFFSGARFTLYNAETGQDGSCGWPLTNAGFTVAMNAVQMQLKFCGKRIVITVGLKTTTATIADTCPACPFGGLDFTEGLFEFFAPSSVGVLSGDWKFFDAAPSPSPSPSPSPPPPPPPSSSSPSPPPPSQSPIVSVSISVWSSPTSWPQPSTPTSTRSSVSSTSTPKSSTTPTPSYSSSPSAMSINYSSGVASGLAEPTGTAVVTPSNNIQELFEEFIQLSAMMAAVRDA